MNYFTCKKGICMLCIFILFCFFTMSCGKANNINKEKKVDGEIKEISTTPSELHEKMFLATRSCWGEVSNTQDYLEDTQWTVYYDGTVEKCEFYHISGYTQKSIWKLNDTEFEQLCKILNKDFQKKIKEVDACDGDGWSMQLYGEDGTVLHSFDGYIYGVDALEKIEVIISNTEDKNITFDEVTLNSTEKMLEMELSYEQPNDDNILSKTWKLYYDKTLEIDICYKDEGEIKTENCIITEAEFEKINKLLSENHGQWGQGEEVSDMWCVQSYNVRGEDIDFFYGDIKGTDCLEEIKDILISY